MVSTVLKKKKEDEEKKPTLPSHQVKAETFLKKIEVNNVFKEKGKERRQKVNK
jgi:hypothetical protein